MRWRGRTIVDTTHALELKEHVYPAVYYVPREDADMNVFARTTHETRCPYKGIASYWSVKDAAPGKNIVWSYRDPIAAVALQYARDAA